MIKTEELIWESYRGGNRKYISSDEIIDGTHRLNTLKGRGEIYVKAYVGVDNER